MRHRLHPLEFFWRLRVLQVALDISGDVFLFSFPAKVFFYRAAEVFTAADAGCGAFFLDGVEDFVREADRYFSRGCTSGSTLVVPWYDN